MPRSYAEQTASFRLLSQRSFLRLERPQFRSFPKVVKAEDLSILGFIGQEIAYRNCAIAKILP